MTLPRALFITGGAGFVGRRLLSQLRATGRPVIALDRGGSLSESTVADGIRVVRGSLLEPETYRDALRSCETVIHLAAATGRASAREHFLINARGTEILLEECQHAGVTRFLFVSSIATTFRDLRGYHYAQAKLQAEGAVLRSRLRSAVVRPTLILGPGAPLLTPLEKLALLPLIVLPGTGRARVQPIHVDDVVRAIAAVVRDDLFDGATYEIGGPEVVSMEELLHRVRRARTGRDAPVLRLPLALLRPPLRLAETAGLGRLLPVSAGQLSSFEWDGVASANRVQAAMGNGLVDLDTMIAGGTDQRAGAEAPAPHESCLTVPVDLLDAECKVFTNHLLGCDPNDYVIAKYRAAHTAVPALSQVVAGEETLIEFARRGPMRAQLADAYAALFAPHSVLRKKLVMLLAILETSQPTYRVVDAAIGGSRAATLSRLAMSGAAAVAALAVGAMVLLPRRVMARRSRQSP
jgi:NADH dehydrogenase